MTHQALQNQAAKKAAKPTTINGQTVRSALFSNRVAEAWVGVIQNRTANTITLKAFRPIKAGMGEGSSDLIGATMITITPEMVGRKVAVFTAVEIKVGKDRLSPAQRNFLRVVKEWGGISMELRDSFDGFAGVVREFIEGTKP